VSLSHLPHSSRKNSRDQNENTIIDALQNVILSAYAEMQTLSSIPKTHLVVPKELKDIFEEYSEDDYNLCITRVDYSTEKFIVDFLLAVENINDKGPITQNWTITATGHRKNKLSFDYEPSIEIKDEHPLLWEYNDIQCQLYFNGQCKDIPKLFYELYTIHKQNFANLKCFNVSFGEGTTDFRPFQYSNGLLTEGSKKLMLKYGECLKQNGLNYTILSERPASFWNGENHVPEDGDLRVMFFGKGFIIAKQFAFVRQD
jgi:hypothetical protein